jgi:hypothetical protein
VPIVDARSPDAAARYAAAVTWGHPLVLTGPRMQEMTEFSRAWFSSGAFDPDEFAASCGTAEAPVCRAGYTGSQLEAGEKMAVKLFVNRYWPQSGAGVYLAQWQFPAHLIEETDGLNDAWRLSAVPEDVVGADLYSHGHSGLNPYQYLFMGGARTQSRLHNDPGAMTILIAALVGAKEVWMVHRDDERFTSGMALDLREPDLRAHPLAAAARVWRHVLVPGDVLVLPPRTLHQVVNASACLSYSRCHLGPCEMREWLRSHDAADAPQMNHAEVVYRAGYALARQDAAAGPQGASPQALAARLALHDAARVLASRLVEEDGARSWLRLCEDLARGLPRGAAQVLLPRSKGGRAEAAGQGPRRAQTGDVVALAPGVAGGPRAGRRATVLKAVAAAAFCEVRFNDLQYPPELVPLGQVRPRRPPPQQQQQQALREGAEAVVAWTVTGEEFPARVMGLHASVDAVELQFAGLGAEWNQWCRAGDVKSIVGRALKVLV